MFRRRQLQRGVSARRHDPLNRDLSQGTKTGPGSLSPYDRRNDDMLSVPKLDFIAVQRGEMAINHQSARGDIEDAGIAPAHGCPYPSVQHHPSAQFAGPLRAVVVSLPKHAASL